MTAVGRRGLDHPALAAAGGSGLHAAIELMWTAVSNDEGGRWYPRGPVGVSTMETITHGYGVPFAELMPLLYTGTYPNLARVPDPASAGWVIAATGGTSKTQIDITTPNSGGPFNFVLFLLHLPPTSGGPGVKVATISAAGAATFTHGFGFRPQAMFAEYFDGTTHTAVDVSSILVDSRINDLDVFVPSTFVFGSGKQILLYAWNNPTVGAMT